MFCVICVNSRNHQRDVDHRLPEVSRHTCNVDAGGEGEAQEGGEGEGEAAAAAAGGGGGGGVVVVVYWQQMCSSSISGKTREWRSTRMACVSKVWREGACVYVCAREHFQLQCANAHLELVIRLVTVSSRAP